MKQVSDTMFSEKIKDGHTVSKMSRTSLKEDKKTNLGGDKSRTIMDYGNL